MPSSTSRWPTISTCEFTMTSFNTRVDRMTEILNNPAMLMALGDGGAHVDMLCDCRLPDLPARHLGAREAGADAGGRRCAG